MPDLASNMHLPNRPRSLSHGPIDKLARAWGTDPVMALRPQGDVSLSAAAWRFAPCHERSMPEIDADLICITLSGARHLSLKMEGRDVAGGCSPRGSVRVVPAGTPAHIEVHETAGPNAHFACFHLYVPASAFSAIGLASKVTLSDPGPGAADPWLEVLAHRLSNTEQSSAPSRLESSYIALAALAHIAGHYSRLPPPETRPETKGGLAAWQQRRALTFIEEHLAREISIAELAELCRLSPFHFARAFRQSVGWPPHAYLTMRRIERAKELLSNPRQELLGIAAAVGYESGSHFAKVFKRFAGVTPSEFRKKV